MPSGSGLVRSDGGRDMYRSDDGAALTMDFGGLRRRHVRMDEVLRSLARLEEARA